MEKGRRPARLIPKSRAERALSAVRCARRVPGSAKPEPLRRFAEFPHDNSSVNSAHQRAPCIYLTR